MASGAIPDLSPAGRAAARRVLRGGERLMWGGENHGLIRAAPWLLMLAAVGFGLWFVGGMLMMMLGFFVDSWFGANRSKTPPAVALIAVVVVGTFFCALAFAAIRALRQILWGYPRAIIVTDQRVVLFDANDAPRAPLHEVGYDLDTVASVNSHAMPFGQGMLNIRLPDDSDGARFVTFTVRAGAARGEATLDALLRRRRDAS